MINNPIDVQTPVDNAVVDINANVEQKSTQISTLVTNESSEVRQSITLLGDALSALIANAIAETNENQAILDGLSTVGGQIDGTATAVNTHTTQRLNALLTSLLTNDAGSLLAQIEALINAIDLSGVATSNQLTAVEQSLTAEIGNIDLSGIATSAQANEIANALSSTLAGSLRKLITDTAQSESASTNALIEDRSAGSIAGFINSALITVRNSVNGTISSRPTLAQQNVIRDVIVAAINAARDSVNNNVTSRNANAVSAITDAVNTRASNDFVEQVSTAWTPVVTYGGDLRNAGQENFNSLTNPEYITLLNAQGAGFLTTLRVGRTIDMQLFIDGNLVFDFRGDFNTTSTQNLIVQGGTSPFPAIKYNDSIEIRARRRDVFAASGAVAIIRAKIRGA